MMGERPACPECRGRRWKVDVKGCVSKGSRYYEAIHITCATCGYDPTGIVLPVVSYGDEPREQI